MLNRALAMLFMGLVCAFSNFAQDVTTSNVDGKGLSTASTSSRQSSDDDDRRFQIGFHFTDILSRKNNISAKASRPGVGVRAGYDFARFGSEGSWVATAESELNFSPRNVQNSRLLAGSNNLLTVDTREDGRVLQGLFGVKVGKKYNKIGFFGKVRPGFIQYTNAKANLDGTRDTATNFTTDLGGVVELYPTKRLITRFDFGDSIVRVGSQTGAYSSSLTPTSPAPALVTLPTRTTHNFQFSAGLGWRF